MVIILVPHQADLSKVPVGSNNNAFRGNVCFIKDKWLIEKVAGTIIMNGGEIQFLTEYSDFSVVEGVLMHHKENKFAAGMLGIQCRILEVLQAGRHLHH
jgi:hypothetical protein